MLDRIYLDNRSNATSKIRWVKDRLVRKKKQRRKEKKRTNAHRKKKK